MDSLMRELVPHMPAAGLFIEPDIPFRKLHNAIEDYARKMRRSEVVVLYDATRMGSGKDGALFAKDRFIFQNTNLEPAHEIKYVDLVGVDLKKKVMGGSKVLLKVNRGRATIDLEMDFSARGKAAPYVKRFLEEAMYKTADEEAAQRKAAQQPASETDAEMVEATLAGLVESGSLSEEDFARLVAVLKSEI